jgi:hypothetical protein
MEPSTNLRRQGENLVWTATGHERPVFLDEHGRRRRWVLAGGLLTGGLSALWLAALIAGAIGFSTLPSMRASSQFLVSRRQARELALVRSHRHVPTAGHRRQSSFAVAAKLAVSRSLIPGE